MENKRQITEKELKAAAKDLNLQFGLIELVINKVRENQVKSIPKEETAIEIESRQAKQLMKAISEFENIVSKLKF